MQPARLGARGLSICREALQDALVITLFGMLGGAPACRAQTALETPQQTNDRIQALSLAAQRAQRDYVIGSGDLISIEVFDVKELTRDARVSQAGTIALPLLPVRLHVAGLTEIQTEQKIAEVLEANGLVTHPQVSVTVKEKRSKPITVIGAVNHPIVYQADRPVTLLEVLSEAGGIANDAGNVVIVTRAAPEAAAEAIAEPPSIDPPKERNAPGSQPPAVTPPPGVLKPENNVPPSDDAPLRGMETSATPSAAASDAKAKDVAEPPPIQITVNLSDLLETGDPKNNMILQAGDVVTVPHAGTVYAVGAVQRPGGFVLTNDRSQMTALKLLALSGGVTRLAKAEHAVIVRKDSSGQQVQVAINLRKIMRQQIEDVPMRPSDILFVPESGGRQAAYRIAEVALAIGAAVAIYRVAYH